jgi:UPF0755 protein
MRLWGWESALLANPSVTGGRDMALGWKLSTLKSIIMQRFGSPSQQTEQSTSVLQKKQLVETEQTEEAYSISSAPFAQRVSQPQESPAYSDEQVSVETQKSADAPHPPIAAHRRGRVPKKRWQLIGLLATLLLAAVLYACLPMQFGKGEEVLFRVTTGSGARVIGRQLQEQGIIRSARVFGLWVRLFGAQGSLKAGEYRLHPGLFPYQIVLDIKQGRVATSGVTIPEGYRLTQIADTLAAVGLVDREEFLALAQNSAAVLPEGSVFNPPNGSLEGYLFPDTYRIAHGTPVIDIIRLMLKRTEEQVAPLVAQAHLPLNLTFHEVLTLASIVEKEARIAEERPLIAGVFLNRLKVGMPLQADPTVKYVLSPAPVRLSLRDIEVDSPYNTYRYSGLPPGPISNAGLAAIKAVLEPASTSYMYFVAKGDGTHVFSATYQEHLAAKRAVNGQ